MDQNEIEKMEIKLKELHQRMDLNKDDKDRAARKLRKQIREAREQVGLPRARVERSTIKDDNDDSDPGNPSDRKKRREERRLRREERQGRTPLPPSLQKHDWKREHPAYLEYCETVQQKMRDWGIVMIEPTQAHSMVGYGYDLITGFEYGVEPANYLEKWRARWPDREVQWFYLMKMSGEARAVVIGPTG